MNKIKKLKGIIKFVLTIFLFIFLSFFIKSTVFAAGELNLGFDQGPCCYCSGPYGPHCYEKPDNFASSTCTAFLASEHKEIDPSTCYSVDCQPAAISAGTKPKSDPLVLNLQVPIPGFGSEIPIDGNAIAVYIMRLYQFFVGALAIVAVVMIMIAGYRWLLSSGSAERVSKSKDMIINAVVGLILGLTSYLLLYTLNPNLVKFNSLSFNDYIDPNSIQPPTSYVLDYGCPPE